MIHPLALTMGDPAGISGEITLKTWFDMRHEESVFYCIDDPDRLRSIAREMNVDVPIVEISQPSAAMAVFQKGLPVLTERLSTAQSFGKPEPTNAAAVIRSIERAVSHAMVGDASAVVTNPINKQALYEGASFAYPGHTEFLGDLAGVDRTVMMLAAPILKVVPVTIHVSLREACETLSTDLIVDTVQIVDADLKKFFGLAAPRLALSGLNPHAGEGGSMGREEIDIIVPAVEILKLEGMNVSGPWPADTLFHEAARSQYDVAVCMYHDQALIPIKALDFAHGVNVTLGLPFIRTSPDHGTAYNIAGTGAASPSSLISAVKMAYEMAQGLSGG